MLARARRALRPLRPIARPIAGWIRVRIRRIREEGVSLPGSPPRRVVRDLPPPGTIRPITEVEFSRLFRRHRDQYRGRWPYMAVAGAAARRLIERDGLHSALELGPNRRALIVNADVLELHDRPDLEAEGRVIIHDARVAPWPVGDKAYDLFVGLQVFEHLTGDQRVAFNEIRRVARHAILSLPIDWDMKDPAHSHHMLSREHAQTWFDPIVPTDVLVGNPGPKARMVFVFEDLPAPEA
jgi:hypothetical protein